MEVTHIYAKLVSMAVPPTNVENSLLVMVSALSMYCAFLNAKIEKAE